MVLGTRVYISVRDMTYRYHCDGFTITVITDVACHLFMRWSTVQPQIHTIPRYIRGTYLHGDRYFCFVTQSDNKQEEAGDTYIHTFIKRPWPVCETRFFYFWGEVGGQTSVSTTAIFSLHFAIEIRRYLNSTSNRTVLLNHAIWNNVHDAALGSMVYLGPAPNYLQFAGSELTATYWLYRSFLFFDLTAVPASWTPVGGSVSLFVHSELHTSSIANPYLYLTQGIQSDPVTLASYGNQLPITTVAGQKDLRDFITPERNEVELTDYGVSLMTPGTISRICIRSEQDVDDIPPPLGANRITYSAEQAGAVMRPWLTLCYPPPEA